MAVAARTLDVLDDDRIGWQIQGRGNGGAQREHALTVAPDLEAPAVIVRDGAAGADRRVGEVRPREGGGNGGRVVVPSAVGADEVGLGIGCPQPLLDVVLVGQLDAVRPRRRGRQGFCRLGGLPFAASDDGKEIAVAHDLLDAGHGRNVVEGGVLEVGAGTRWPHHPGVQHAVEIQVVDEAWPAKHLVGQVDTSQVLRCRWGELDVEGRIADLHVQVDDSGQVGIGADARAVGGREHAGHQPHLFDVQRRLVRCRAPEQLARLGAHPPHSRPGDRDGQAARGQALVR